MKHIKSFLILFTSLLIISCSDFLDYSPQGTVSEEQFNTPERVDGLVTAAYAQLGNDFWARPHSHMWAFGSVRAGDGFKGGGSVADQYSYHRWEVNTLITVDDGRIDENWVEIFDGVARANEALRKLKQFTEADWPEVTIRTAEARFIRAHFYFVAKRIWKMLPWIDETIPVAEIKLVGNRELTNDQLWDKIAEDFQYGVDNLPEVQPEPGRVNKYAAAAYLAKVRLYQAYEQDENHNVVNINAGKLQDVVDMCDMVINSGEYDLHDDFGKNFVPDYESGIESVFSIRYSIEDGTPNGRIQMATSLNYNMLAPYGCCDFHNPSYTTLNSFKTDAVTGLPMFDTYNDDLLYDIDTWQGLDNLDGIDWMGPTVDPRMDHTIAIPTHPFKYDPDFLMTKAGRRVPEVYGYLSTMKETEHYASSYFKKIGPFFGTARDLDIIRYDDVLLMKAEALIELGSENEALPLINQIRARAANSTGWLVQADGSPTANYFVEEYQDGVNCTWDQDFARKALQWERRLEFSMEGSRFFDLVRWGIAAETMNEYYAVESTRFQHLVGANFTKNKNEYLPIPQNQITLTEGAYIQNTNY
jgi:starch-binding outer membrane protein, SusD/RagB family